MDFDIVYENTQTLVYCDANWASNKDDHKSTSNYVFYWKMLLLARITKKKTISYYVVNKS